jgi:cytochrome P450
MTTRIPPGPRLPAPLQHLMLVVSRRQSMRAFRRRYGSAFTIRPLTGPAVVLSDPALVRQLFLTSSDLVGNAELNLGRVFGPASLLGLEGERHHQHRKLLAPPFYGQRMQSYEAIVEEETRREAASWPEGEPVEVLPPMTRITLNVMLRAIFGSDGPELDALRVLTPLLTSLGTRLFLLPLPRTDLGRLTPWGRFNGYRRRFDAAVDALIARAQADPAFADRHDVLSIMLRARYDDGEPMSHQDIADEVLTLLVAGHETTAGTLAWAIERICRHPSLLARLASEASAGGGELRRATILEVQRIRPVVDIAGRQVLAGSVRLGEWEIPHGYTILVGIHLMHSDDSVFPDAAAFNPDRFAGVRPDRYAWVPFGGGYRRCIGAAFAEMEMDIVIRTLLRDFELDTTGEPDERWHSRGISFVPAKGGRVVVRRRAAAAPARPVPSSAASCPVPPSAATSPVPPSAASHPVSQRIVA